MNGVMMPGISAGSNQVGASEMCTPQVSCPSAPAALAGPGDPASRVTAKRATASRRVMGPTRPPVRGFTSRTMVGSLHPNGSRLPSRWRVIVHSSWLSASKAPACPRLRRVVADSCCAPAHAGALQLANAATSGGQDFPCTGTPNEGGRTRRGPAATRLGTGVQGMRESRDAPGRGSPHGVSLWLRLEMPGFVPFWRIGAGAAFHAQRINLSAPGEVASKKGPAPLAISLAKWLPDAQR